jgi:nicotinate phosphoribosyltransferase
MELQARKRRTALLHTASREDIIEGRVTDVYFERTEKILKARGINRYVRAEIVAKGLARDWQWAVFAGAVECAALLDTLSVDVRMMKEGTLFHPFEPVMEIRGRYLDFARYETALLGLICQASGVATMAARCRKAAGKRMLMSFGARRMHPTIAPMVERNAYIGGCDGVSVGLGAALVGQEAVGTMPHALILNIGDTVEATKAFHEFIDPRVPRVCLIDTFNDEKIEALNVAKALGHQLAAIRLDTPGSRRGHFLQIMEEVRWELDLRGYDHVKIYVSGGLDEYQILRYNPLADGYGVGTAISNAPVVDFSLDIVEIDGEPVAKRGKMSGSKQVYRCPRCLDSVILPLKSNPPQCPCGTAREPILASLSHRGELGKKAAHAVSVRDYVLAQLELADLSVP